MEYQFSERVKSLKPSAIREILKNSSDPSVIPLSAGNPAPDAFPYDAVRQISQDLLQNTPIDALQYGVTEGYAPCASTCWAICRRSTTWARKMTTSSSPAGPSRSWTC